MDIPFSYEIAVEGGWVFGAIDGVLVIGPDPFTHPNASQPDWTVEEVLVDAVRVTGRSSVETGRVELPVDHWMHDRLLAAVLERKRRSIDEQWATHITAKLAVARRGFALVADPAA